MHYNLESNLIFIIECNHHDFNKSTNSSPKRFNVVLLERFPSLYLHKISRTQGC